MRRAKLGQKQSGFKMKKLKNTCNIGEIGESAFLHAAISLGLVVSQPFGHGTPYDFIVDVQGKLIKVQIKASRWQKVNKHLRLQFNLNNRDKKIKDVTSKFDILVGFDITYKVFYIIPAKNITAATVTFSSKTKPYIFKNNWSLFK